MADAIKRLPIIRHARYFWHVYHGSRHYEMWRSMGMIGGWSIEEIEWLNNIWRGKA